MHKRSNILMNEISFAKAINLAISDSMEIDDSIICYGLGATDPNATTIQILHSLSTIEVSKRFE